ncbi:pheromone A receptor-domain-containing protein [Amylostereum chailletii]|nr:pheromone A receptor-domain-containing protein [Amylostereum chailletii]
MDPTYPAVPVANFSATILTFLTLLVSSWGHSWNVGTQLLGLWVVLESAITGAEAIVWSGTSDNLSPLWCDISSHLALASNIGVPACSLIITRRLYHIARMRTVEYPSRREKLRSLLSDLALGLGVPAVVMCLYYVVQPCRFIVVENYGCASSTVSSGVSLILLDSWGVVLPAISATVYCPKIIWIFYHHQRDLNRFLHRSTTINRIRYIHILSIACIDILITLPVGVLGVILQFSDGPFSFWPGWTAIHGDDWGPILLSADEWTADGWTRFTIYFNQWINAFLAVMFFFLFGLTMEARTKYRRAFWAVVRVGGCATPTGQKSGPDVTFLTLHAGTTAGSLPITGSRTRTVSAATDVGKIDVEPSPPNTEFLALQCPIVGDIELGGRRDQVRHQDQV